MPSLSAAILGFIALVVVVMFRLKFSTRRNVPFPAWKADPLNAYARLLRASAGTQIDILEHSTAPLLASKEARALVGSWVRGGATVRVLLHRKGDDDAAHVAEIASAGGTGTLSVFVLDDAARTSALAEDTRTFHFVVARSPDQLWLEGYHAEGDDRAQLCEYIPGAARDPRWRARSDDFERLVADATRINGG